MWSTRRPVRFAHFPPLRDPGPLCADFAAGAAQIDGREVAIKTIKMEKKTNAGVSASAIDEAPPPPYISTQGQHYATHPHHLSPFRKDESESRS